VLHPDLSDVIELRAIGVRSRQWPSITSGYFVDREACANAAVMLSPLAEGVYFTLNRINPALLARALNRLRGRDDSSETTADHHVSRRLWLPIDCDPVRPKGISATEEERHWALERAYAIRAHLWSEGWSSPIVADSGNGSHLLYQVDLASAAATTSSTRSRTSPSASMTSASTSTSPCSTRRGSGSCTAR
jgi:hypothetical protein